MWPVEFATAPPCPGSHATAAWKLYGFVCVMTGGWVPSELHTCRGG